MPAVTHHKAANARKFSIDENGIVLRIPAAAKGHAFRYTFEGASVVHYKLGDSTLTAADVEAWGKWRASATIDTFAHPTTYRITLGVTNYDYATQGGDAGVEDVVDGWLAAHAATVLAAGYTATKVGTDSIAFERVDESTFLLGVSIDSGTGTISQSTQIEGGDPVLIQGFDDDVAATGATHVAFKSEPGETADMWLQSVELREWPSTQLPGLNPVVVT